MVAYRSLHLCCFSFSSLVWGLFICFSSELALICSPTVRLCSSGGITGPDYIPEGKPIEVESTQEEREQWQALKPAAETYLDCRWSDERQQWITRQTIGRIVS